MERTLRSLACLLLVLYALPGYSENPVLPESGVSAGLATQRAASIASLSYDLELRIPRDETAPLRGRLRIDFDLASGTDPLQLDFRHGEDKVLSLRLNGEEVPYRVSNEHIVIPDRFLEAGAQRLDIEFLAPQGSVNRNPDFLFTLFVPDRARSTFPLFDQPDLKARYTLTLQTPGDWVAIANAPLIGESVSEEYREFRFAPSDPIPSYLFAFVAGKFEEVTREVDGRSLTLLHRETDRDKLSRNLDDIFRIHGEALEWLERYTGIPYPFQKFGFVLIPDFPYGGMEHVGAIAYRASSLLLEQDPSENQLINRAQLIAHETAHMWFGNLVTMRWFDDVWTKEVFANFMADKIVNPQFPGIDHDLNFLVSHYPQAYAVDRSAGANPIRQQLDNLNLAGQMYGPIIYHKAPIMMRQLELLLGPEAFRDGLRSYLARFAYANATWPELVGILDTQTDMDLRHWSEVWVNSAGMPEFLLAADGENLPELQQRDPYEEQRVWPQQFSILALRNGEQLAASMTSTGSDPLPQSFAGATAQELLLNANSFGYGHFPVSTELFESWPVLTDLQRGALLLNGFENLLAPPYRGAAAYFDRLLPLLPRMENPLLTDLAAEQLYTVYFTLLSDAERTARTRSLEDMLWQATLAQTDASMTKKFFKLYAGLALSADALERVRGVWLGEDLVENLTLQESEQIQLAEILAVRLPGRATQIIARQLKQTDNPDRRRRLEFIAPALSPEPEVRDAFFASLADPANRAVEVWASGALRRLHDPTRLAHSRDYILPSLELLEEIQVTGDIFFPSAWLNASLGSHRSPAAADIVRRFLAERPDYNPQLRMKILQAADPLFRAAGFQEQAKTP